MATVTFETQCYEMDYEYLLTGDHLKETILNCNYDFSKRVVIINKVNDREKVEALACAQKERGVIDAYYFADDYIDEALKHFNIQEESFKGGYYYSRCQYVGLFLADTDYVLHFTTDSYIREKNNSMWIEESITLMQEHSKYVCATPLWNNSHEGALNEAVEMFGDWFAGYGFSDNCYLVPTKLFKQQIYNEYNQASDRYPWYAGECFEKRVDSYMRNHDLLRLINTKVSYVHENLPKPLLVRARFLIKRIVSAVEKRIRAQFFPLPQKVQPPITGQESAEIREYRKKIKIYDIFTFFNELELLEIRLNMLAPYVDYFVIIECAETFSGKPKPLTFAENKDRFKQFEHKIIHYVVEGVPKDEADLQERRKRQDLDSLERDIINYALTSDNVPKGATHWLKEFYQKESIRKALVGLENDDVCFISDVDEIWNPETVIDIRKDDVYKLRQLMYAYYLNNRSSEPWAGTLVTKYKNIKHNCLNHLRTVTKTKYTYVDNGGWHFTNQGGADRIRKKIESYGHQEFNTDDIKKEIENKMKENRDFVGRTFTFWVDESDLPAYLLENKEKYKNFFK